MKKCFKCLEIKPLSMFYKHKMMMDGHLNKCKECTKSDVRKNRLENVDYYREYDKDRGNRQGYKYCHEYRTRFPNKYRSHQIVGRAIRNGTLFRMPCEVCGSTDHVHAHHDDYLMPLNVRWLCASHHKIWHLENGEGRNA